MYKKLLTFSIIAASLAACGDDKPKQDVQQACNDPAAVQNIRSQIQDSVKQKARNYAQNDNRHYIDADKIIAAGSDLNISLADAKATAEANPVCAGQLSITVPFSVVESAHAYAPLVYGKEDIGSVLQRHTGNGKVGYNGNGVFTQTIRYKAESGSGGIQFSLADNLDTAIDAVSALLLPYGVKNHIEIDGKTITREDALKQLKGEAEKVQEPDQPLPEDPQSILENNSASSVFATVDNALQAETMTPQSTQPVPGLSDSELEQARSSHENADNEINRVWNSMEQTVRKELTNEQRDWISQKNNSCRQAAARAPDPQRAEYLQLQCSTRMTRERIQYLKGYSIQ